MSNEVSSDVGYVINQLNEIKNNKNKLKVIYNDVQINGENSLTKDETQQQPTIQIENQAENTNYSTLVMIDPDAPSSAEPITGPFIHWILANIKSNDASDGLVICPYAGPGPRAGTGTHRYIFLLYESNEAIKKDEEKTYDDIPKRRKFPLEKFVQDNQLQLVDVTRFSVDA